MKNIFKYVLLLAGFFAISCSEDAIVPYTPGIVTEDVAIQNSADVQILMNSCYALMYNRDEVEFSSVFTDEVGIGLSNGGQGIINDDAYFYFTLNQNSPAASAVWTGNYIALSRINRVIKFTNTLVPASPADALVLNNLKAQALTLRALAHLRIMSYFSTDLTNDAALAGILADRIFLTSEKENPRATNGQFYTLIQKDLTDAIALFGGTTAVSPVTTVATVRLAMGLKARAYSFKGDYPNAVSWANQVIASGISLATKPVYPNVFFSDTEPGNTEVIFRLKRTLQQASQDSNFGNIWAGVNSTKDGSAFFEIGRSLFNKLNVNDTRYATIVHPTSVIDPNYATSANYITTDRLILGKHRGSTAQGPLNVDFKIMRLSEMVLIKAEAAAFNSNLPEAAAQVKVIRDVRFGVPQVVATPASKMDAYKLVVAERRIEFAFEGYRFLDLKRFGTLAGVGIDRDPADYANYPAGNPSLLPITSNKFTLPIPTEELTVNPNIVRNPGY